MSSTARSANDASRSRSRRSIAPAVQATHGRPGCRPDRLSSPTRRTPPPPNDRRYRGRTRRDRPAPVAARSFRPAAAPAPRRPRPRSCRRPPARPRGARHRAPGHCRGCRRARQRARRRHAGKPPDVPSPCRGRRQRHRRRPAYRRALPSSRSRTLELRSCSWSVAARGGAAAEMLSCVGDRTLIGRGVVCAGRVATWWLVHGRPARRQRSGLVLWVRRKRLTK